MLEFLVLLIALSILADWPPPELLMSRSTVQVHFFIRIFKQISMDFQKCFTGRCLKSSHNKQIWTWSSEELATKHLTVLDNVPVEQALEQVLRANNLTYELQPDSNIYIVTPITKPDAELLTRVYLLKHANVSKARIAKTLKISYSSGSSTNDISNEGQPAAGSWVLSRYSHR